MSKPSPTQLFDSLDPIAKIAVLEAASMFLQDSDNRRMVNIPRELAVTTCNIILDYVEVPKPPDFKLVEPKISISESKQIAVFDGFVCVWGFRPFSDEDKALATAKAWIKNYTDAEPEIVRPRITRITMATRKTR